jgi:putative phosphoribosyl transferase
MPGPRKLLPRRSITEIHDSTGRLTRRADRVHRDGQALLRGSRVMLARTTASLASSRLVLRQAWSAGDDGTAMATAMPDQSHRVSIPLCDGRLAADLTLPAAGRGLVVFSPGSGDSSYSSRNRYVARVFEQAGLGSLLVDLLTLDDDEAALLIPVPNFEISLAARRLAGVIDWLRGQPETAGQAICLFGASDGAAAALVAAVDRPLSVSAVVSHGVRPDLVEDVLASVEVPVLFIVGSLDYGVLDLNRRAAQELRSPARLEIVPGATHLFEEQDALDQVAGLARAWFLQHVG